MSARQKTRYALLGLLSWRPMSGYDIKKLVDIGLSHFWNENYGQIYPTLNALVTEGLAKKAVDGSTGKRKRIVYSITPSGEQAFLQWLSQPADRPTVRNELQLKFFLSGQRPTKTSLALIREYQAQQHAVLQDYRESEAILRDALETGDYPDEIAEILSSSQNRSSRRQKAKQCRMFLLTLRHGILAVQARLAWCDEVIEELTPA